MHCIHTDKHARDTEREKPKKCSAHKQMVRLRDHTMTEKLTYDVTDVSFTESKSSRFFICLAAAYKIGSAIVASSC